MLTSYHFIFHKETFLNRDNRINFKWIKHLKNGVKSTKIKQNMPWFLLPKCTCGCDACTHLHYISVTDAKSHFQLLFGLSYHSPALPESLLNTAAHTVSLLRKQKEVTSGCAACQLSSRPPSNTVFENNRLHPQTSWFNMVLLINTLFSLLFSFFSAVSSSY